MDFALLKFARRFNQGLQLFFSPALKSPQKALQYTTLRYANPREIEFYRQIAHEGFDDFEKDLISTALKFLKPNPKVLVVGCGCGREALAFEKLHCKVTGVDPVPEMIRLAKTQNSNGTFIEGDVFSLPDETFDLIYISASINGHIWGRPERLRFYRRLNNFCHKSSLLISVPEIRPLKPNDHYFWASQILRLRHWAQGQWQTGDTARSFLGNHNDTSQLLYYHFYPSHAAFVSEMKDSGFQLLAGQKYIFSPDLSAKFKPLVFHLAKYFPPDAQGGMESSLQDMCRGLAKAGFSIHCWVTGLANSWAEEIQGVKVTRWARVGQLFSSPISFQYIKNLSASRESDLVHLHVPNPTGALAGLNSTVPMVISYHCDVLSYPLLFKFYQPWLKQQLKKAQAIVVSSPQLKDHSLVLAPYRQKCHVIPFGIDPNDFEMDPIHQQRVQDFKKIFGRPVILFVGRLVPYKGLNYLIEAMGSVEATLLIVGHGPELAQLKFLVQELKLEEKVHFMGSIERKKLGAYYKESEIVILPSIDAREAFGICLIEALAFGKPLITTEIGTGTSFVNQDQMTGFVVPPKDVQALSNKINLLLTNSPLYHQFSKHALAHFAKNFTLDRMISAYKNLYEKLLGYHLPKF